ncbi:hypothetical protein [Pedobacter jeongneungensis]|uniref:hypothetical protein n=1 Tax=Pedobacter jeongneungensis TaxID=947309 RepID=UPI000469BC74|nr:hypothetical protein [Pedobacter jeongneungensis]
MDSYITISEIKILKGPDRLLRMRVLISQCWDMEIELFLVATLAEALIYKHHNLSVDFPVKDLLEIMPKGAGEFFKGKVGIDFFFRVKGPSVFEVRYYTEELETVRAIVTANSVLDLHEKDLHKYENKYTIHDLRNGTQLPPINKVLNYIKGSKESQ